MYQKNSVNLFKINQHKRIFDLKFIKYKRNVIGIFQSLLLSSLGHLKAECGQALEC